MTAAWTIDDVRRARDELRAVQIIDPPKRDETFHAAAALVTSFVLDPLIHVGQAGVNLKADCIARSRADLGQVSLKDAARKRILRQLHTKEAFRQALNATTIRPDDTLQRMLEAWLGGTAVALDLQTPEELAATLQVVDWFADTELASSLPTAAEVRTRVEYASLLSPLRALAGPHFHGRATELSVLESYVGGPNTPSLQARPPLLIYGPGGMGKSSLVAKFILDNLGAFPLVYLDCDRAGLVAMEPITLLAEAVRQTGLQFPEFAFPAEQLRARWLERIAKAHELESGAQPVTTLGRTAIMKEFQVFVRDLRLERRKVLLVIDTFEEVQYHSPAVVSEVFQFLSELQELLPNLRTVVAGRNPVPDFCWEPLEIDELDIEAAKSFLKTLGIESASVRESLSGLLGGNPLSLRLAADLSRLGESLNFGDLRSHASDAEIQGVLYGRILRHVHHEDVRLIAHPGLILRRITPDVIRRVLAQPCGLGAVDEARAEHLFGLLQNELSLVVSDGNAVRHRTDVRRVMLRPLKQSESETVRQIEQAAVRYYFPYDDATSRAEEVYHRLSMGCPLAEVEQRWLADIDDRLRSAVDELEGASRTYLAARLGIQLYDDRDSADQLSWERFAAKQAQVLLELDKPLEVIRLLRRRAERLPNSQLYWMHAQALRRSGQNLEARQVARQGIARLLDDSHWDRRYATTEGPEEPDEASVPQQTMEWFAGPGSSQPPSAADVKRQIEWNRLLQPLRRLATRSFAGRAMESTVLQRYVLSTNATVFAARRPLLICGAAGMGKSTLLARFVLDNIKRLSFVYIDFRASNFLTADGSPVLTSIVPEVARQLSLQLPDFPQANGFSDWKEEALRHALARARWLPTEAAPLLVVLDNVDELAFRSHPPINDLCSFLGRLQADVPGLRPVLVARRTIPGFGFELLEIGRLDAESARAFLAAEGVESPSARDSILRLTDGTPFAMRIAAELVRAHGTEALPQGDMGGASQEYLLSRLLDHIHDATVRHIVPVAIVLRRITPDLLRQVVAGPAEVTIASDSQAREIFAALAREMSLFIPEDGVLYPRADVRSILLRSLRDESIKMITAIHVNAVAYYQHRDDLADRAEEVYHRLALGQPIGEIDDRWQDGISTLLRSAVGEVEGDARGYLAAKLGIDLDELDWLEADQSSWEAYAATRATDLLSMDQPREALDLLKKRSTRQPRSRLFAIEAETLLALAQPREALTVILQGLELWPDDPELPSVLVKCRSALGTEEPTLSAQLGVEPLAAVAWLVPPDVDRSTLADALAATLPTGTDVVNAWSESFGRLPLRSLSMMDIVSWAADNGRLEDLIAAAYRYAPQSSALHELIERSRSPEQIQAGLFGRGRMVLNRMIARQFLAGLVQGSARHRILLVNGPRGSGKSFTIQLAQWLVGHQMQIVAVELSRATNSRDATRQLYDLFGWRWESLADTDVPTIARVSRYADMIHARARRHQRPALVVFYSDESSSLSQELRDLLADLTRDPGELAFILIGLEESIFHPQARPYLVIEELHDFSHADIQQGLKEAMRHMRPELGSTILERIFSSVTPGPEYNKRVSLITRDFLDRISDG